ncbi:hypothetical protein FD46_GL001483 [Liquorilactobacillus oeni DSM 19972]|uniref:Uncharacterized protein n=1 Tax=Liquorilactobacillus oeni DSM 19972 TaxID=1423777 RepID=A0A0R1MEP6_9LACO|nr:hypothetical protein FD46_GL001483 [Liquorilactobacillus oeni DSM 19972]
MGNTGKCDYCKSVKQDHPHIRGEYKEKIPDKMAIKGSPPHTWGIQGYIKRKTGIIRITPTYVGNTINEVTLTSSGKDHPHIRGEYQKALKESNATKGSPPHTWGILNLLDDPPFIFRITPTYVGNTIIRNVELYIRWDHPHIRGEYSAYADLTQDGTGSPPHTWGIHLYRI